MRFGDPAIMASLWGASLWGWLRADRKKVYLLPIGEFRPPSRTWAVKKATAAFRPPPPPLPCDYGASFPGDSCRGRGEFFLGVGGASLPPPPTLVTPPLPPTYEDHTAGR